MPIAPENASRIALALYPGRVVLSSLKGEEGIVDSAATNCYYFPRISAPNDLLSAII